MRHVVQIFVDGELAARLILEADTALIGGPAAQLLLASLSAAFDGGRVALIPDEPEPRGDESN